LSGVGSVGGGGDAVVVVVVDGGGIVRSGIMNVCWFFFVGCVGVCIGGGASSTGFKDNVMPLRHR